jgi:hypothetical protein
VQKEIHQPENCTCAPKADGSVHIPNSDQKPAQKYDIIKFTNYFKIGSKPQLIAGKKSSIETPYQFGSQGESTINPTGKG